MGQFSDRVAGEGDGASKRPGPRVVIVSGPVGGVGKTTFAVNLSVALLRLGLTVGVVDLDMHSRALSRWVRRRARRADADRDDLVMPAAADAAATPSLDPEAAETMERGRLRAVLDALGAGCDIVVVDAPPTHGPLSLSAHACADLVVTLAAESMVSLDDLFEIGPAGERTDRPGAYSRMLWEARRKRAERGGRLDWLLLRARALDHPDAALKDALTRSETLLGARGGLRMSERAAWRSGLAEGLCALDPPRTPASEIVAQEIRDLVIVAKLAGLEGAALAF